MTMAIHLLCSFHKDWFVRYFPLLPAKVLLEENYELVLLRLRMFMLYVFIVCEQNVEMYRFVVSDLF
jgi:hypothetical protein